MFDEAEYFLVIKLQSQQSSVEDAAATSGHRFGFLRRYLRPRNMALAAWIFWFRSLDLCERD